MVDGQIQDIETYVVDNYDEYVRIRGSVEITQVTDKQALWQGVCGEIKTPIGECQGIGMEDYGCDIWKILGQNLTPVVIDQAKYYILELVPKYEEIEDMSVNDITTYSMGRLILNITVYSIFGEITGDVVIG